MFMAWDGSRRRSQLPSDWKTIRERVKARANGQCEQLINGQRCPNPGTDCHHAGEPDDHRDEVLEWLCRDCHNVETAKEQQREQIINQARLLHPMQRRKYLQERLGVTELPKRRQAD